MVANDAKKGIFPHFISTSRHKKVWILSLNANSGEFLTVIVVTLTLLLQSCIYIILLPCFEVISYEIYGSDYLWLIIPIHIV